MAATGGGGVAGMEGAGAPGCIVSPGAVAPAEVDTMGAGVGGGGNGDSFDMTLYPSLEHV